MSPESPAPSSSSGRSRTGLALALGTPAVTVLVLVLVVAAVLLAPRFDPRADEGEPIPADLAASPGTPSVPDPAEHGGEGAETEEDVIAGMLRFEMESAVLEQAQTDHEISSECAATSETEYECTVTFAGEPVHSTIEVQDVSGLEVSSGGTTVIDNTRISYQVVEQEVVVTDRAVQLAMLDAVADSKGRDTSYSAPRCDEDIPSVQVVADGEQIEATCYAEPDGAGEWPNWSQIYDVEADNLGPTVVKR